MHLPLSTRRPGTALVLRAACLLAAAGLFAACDRHSAEEVPENYGHGSSHRPAVPDHQVDSSDAKHFSDTAGTKEEQAGETSEKPSASPTVTPAGHFF